MRLSRVMRGGLALAAAIELLLFARASPLALLAISVGAATTLFGLFYYYRPASITGLLIVAVSAGATIEIPTLTELGYILMAMLGMFTPVLILLWLCLSREEDEGRIRVMRHAIPALAYGVGSLLSAPICLLVLSLFAPTLVASLAVMTEIAIVLLTAIVVGIAFLWRKVRPERMEGVARTETE